MENRIKMIVTEDVKEFMLSSLSIKKEDDRVYFQIHEASEWVEMLEEPELSKEDIESLGFEFLPKKSLGNLTLRFEIKQLIERIDQTDGGDDTMWWNVYLKLYPDRRRVFITGDISDGSEREKFFEGEVKNKSELKKILKQLGILSSNEKSNKSDN